MGSGVPYLAHGAYMKALIVDDERLARDWLRRLLLQHPEVEIVGEAANVVEALQMIEALSPDLLFLDIQMPDGSGFDLLSRLDLAPAVIFTTAYDKYAIRGFEVSALDYLLKPIESKRLSHALDKYYHLHVTPSPKSFAGDGKVFIKDGERCWLVSLEQILLFESEGNFTRVYFDDQRPLLSRTLTQIEARLNTQYFTRTSRSQIVNLQYVTNMVNGLGGSMVLTLNNDLKVTMSRRRSADFKQLNRF